MTCRAFFYTNILAYEFDREDSGKTGSGGKAPTTNSRAAINRIQALILTVSIKQNWFDLGLIYL